MWILPSRGRPHSVKRFFTQYLLSNADSEGVLWLDEDDAHNYENIGLPPKWTTIIKPSLGGTGPITEEFFKLYPNEPWYGLLGDDVVPYSNGDKEWDKALIDAAGFDGLAYGDDLLNGESHAAHPVVGGELVRNLGFLALPGLKRIYIDNVLMDVAKKVGKCHYLPEIKMEHLHFSNGKSEMDATYEKPNCESDRKIYEAWRAKFNDKITIVCVKHGEKYGPEYVNILCDMLVRNLPSTLTFKFVCFTDNKDGIDSHIETRPLPDGVKGWWNKLYLFKNGLFEKGERIFYFDLDTVIVGNCSPLFDYKGDFATLRDFYHQSRLGPAIMCWEAGNHTEIWENWAGQGVPEHEGNNFADSDLFYLNKHFSGRKVDYLQDLLPKFFVSYKVDCRWGIPSASRIVCFHGEPRPHNAGGWVEKIWNKGGVSVADFILHCNTSDEEMERNIDANFIRNVPVMAGQYPNTNKILLVGGGPSLEYDLHMIKFMQEKQGAYVMAINGALDYLYNHDIQANGCVIIDSRIENLEFIKNRHDIEYFLASQVNPQLFDYLNGAQVRMFHVNTPGMQKRISDSGKFSASLGGGRTAGLISMTLAYCLGYREMHLFGYDSSYGNDMHHAYPQSLNDKQNIIEVEWEGQKFKSSPWMVQQAEDFIILVQELLKMGAEIAVHGTGLLPAISHSIKIEENIQPKEVANVR